MQHFHKAGYRIIAFLMVLICFIQSSVPVMASAVTMTDIRVGLTSMYSAKSNITIKNSQISFGYCIDETFRTETSLSSSTGFQFTPAKGYYYIMSKTFNTYKEALSVAKTIEKLGVKAYPAAIYRNYYKVYVGGETNKTAMTAIYEKIKGRYGYSYSALQSNNSHRILVSGKNVSLIIDGKKKGAYPQFKAGVANSAGALVLNLGSRSYRGRIEIGTYGKSTLTAVNIINIESYLLGVVPSEMVSSWPEEALKAQAVCSRSFALMKTGYTADSNIGKGYYLNDTTSHQAYKGYAVETNATRKAVQATRGEVVSNGTKIITAYYHSTSGGRTESGADVWGLKNTYYPSVTDTYETEPERGPWIISYSKSELLSKLNKAGYKLGSVQSLNAQIITASNRIYSLKIKGSSGSTTLQSGTVRTTLDLYSTKFKIIRYGDNPDRVYVAGRNQKIQADIANCYILSGNNKAEKASSSLEQYIVKGAEDLMNYPAKAPTQSGVYYFAGMGYGHGVGMSQSGAKGMAKEGFTYKEIIEYYYSGCTVKNVSSLK